jgi:hypothetical protein
VEQCRETLSRPSSSAPRFSVFRCPIPSPRPREIRGNQRRENPGRGLPSRRGREGDGSFRGSSLPLPPDEGSIDSRPPQLGTRYCGAAHRSQSKAGGPQGSAVHPAHPSCSDGHKESNPEQGWKGSHPATAVTVILRKTVAVLVTGPRQRTPVFEACLPGCCWSLALAPRFCYVRSF